MALAIGKARSLEPLQPLAVVSVRWIITPDPLVGVEPVDELVSPMPSS